MYSSDHVVLSQVSLFEKRAVDNSIAIVFANKEYVSDGYVQNVVCSMKRLQLRNWVVVAVDRKAYSILVDVYGEHAVHFDEQFWGSQKRQSLRVDYHATPDYLHFVHLKTLFSYKLLLQTSLNVAVTDGDTVRSTFRNHFYHFVFFVFVIAYVLVLAKKSFWICAIGFINKQFQWLRYVV